MDQPRPDVHYRVLEGRLWPHVLHRGRYLPIPAGGAEGGEGGEGGGEGGDGGDGGGDGGDGGEDKPLGAAGEKALEEWKRRAREAEKTSKATAAELKKLQDASASDAEKALAKAAEEAEKKVRDQLEPAVRAQRLENAILRAAGNRFADVEDAVVHLRDTDGLVDDDGQVDAKALEAALKKLLERKPHLAAGGGSGPGRPAPRPNQGAGTGGSSDEREDSIWAGVAARNGVKVPTSAAT